jgi:hypothetical protein
VGESLPLSTCGRWWQQGLSAPASAGSWPPSAPQRPSRRPPAARPPAARPPARLRNHPPAFPRPADDLHGLLLKVSDIAICRTPDGRKCRLGEGGFGVVYKAMMNGVDEVAVKLAKVGACL